MYLYGLKQTIMKKILWLLLCVFFFSSSALSQWSNDAGKNLQITGLGGEQTIPKIAMVPNGNFFIAFFSLSGKGYHDSGAYWAPTRNIHAQRFDADGVPVLGNAVLVYGQGNITAWTQVLSFVNDGDDGFYIGWHDYSISGNVASAWIQHVNAGGEVQFQANGVLLSDAHANQQFNPMIASPEQDPNVYVFWQETDGNQNLYGIFGQKVSPDGDLIWGSQGNAVFNLSGLPVRPLYTLPADNDILLVYEYATGGVSSAIKAIRFNDQGEFVWPGQEVYVSSVHSSKMHMDIAFYDHTQWTFAWGDDRNGPREIYAQNLHPDGTLGIVETQTYLLNLLADPEERGAVEGGGEYDAGTEVTAVATAHEAGEPVSHHVRIFPNPSDSNLFISSGGRILSVDITDMTGRTVYSTKAGGVYEIRINTSTLRPGAYVVRIALDQDVYFEKLTIER